MQQSEKELLEKQEALKQEQAEKKFVEEEKYKSLQSEYTRNRQNEIKIAVELVKENKWKLLTLEKDLQDKVVKEIYWLENVEEVKAVYWNSFYKEEKEDKDDDDERTSAIEKELKILKHRQEKKEVDDAILRFKNENKILFDIEDAEQKLRDELKYISSELSVEERVKRAWRSAFWAISSTDALYTKIMQTQWGWASFSQGKQKQNTWVEDTSIADAVLAKTKLKKWFY